MAQHDYIIANQSGAAFRADLNNGLAAIVSQNSGATQPSTTYAYQWWADTTTGELKLRNSANNAWITVGTLADANLGLLAQSGGTLTGALLADDSGTAALPAIAFDGDPNTGIFSPGADQLGIATNGVERVEFGTSEVVFNDGGADIDFRIEGDTNPDLFKIDAGTDEVQVANLNGGPLAGTRNRIINGDMRIDQRNAGASVTINASSVTYSVDRWSGFGMATAGVFTLNRSGNVPDNWGNNNSFAATCTTADATIAAGDRYFINQAIEGYNISDFGFGTSEAKTVTLSFWVQSSLTGTYCVALLNASGTRSYVSEYTINTADTWEYKTITISGDTTGTWETTNLIGVAVRFALATGTTFQTTANAWAAGNFNATSNQVNWMSSSSSRTFRITGVQLEAGSVATPFERRSYGQELSLAQRYCYKSPGGGSITNAWGSMYSTSAGRVWSHLPVTMRAVGTATFAGSGFERIGSGGTTGTVANVVVSTHAVSFDGVSLLSAGIFGQPFAYLDSFSVSAEL